MREEKSVYKALFSEQKSKKVELKLQDEIEEYTSRAFGLEEFFDDALDEALKKYILAKDIWRFDFTEANNNLEDSINRYKKALDDLGVDSTPQLKQAEKDLAGVNKLYDDMKRKLDQF